MRTSYSQSNTYKECSQHWSYRYVDKLQTEDVGSSTFFGSAVDGAIIDLLTEPTKNCYKTFENLWQAGRDFKGQPTQIFDNDKINFAHADYDLDVLKAFSNETEDTIEKWMTELKIAGYPNYDEAYKHASKAKKNVYKHIPLNQLRFFNRMSWLSLYYKGLLLIESFEQQFVPKIEKVLAVQKHSSIKDEVEGDSIAGYIDMILLLKGHDKPIIFDLKTSARLYKQEQIDHSDQLTIYLAMEGQRYGTDTVGYIVLPKAINKEIEAHCEYCGYKRDGRHKTCNNEITHTKELLPEDIAKGVTAKTTTGRCGGPWNETVVLKPEVQILIQKKTDDQVEKVMDDQSNIIYGMKNRVVFKNLSKCQNWYGTRCPFFNLCHKNSEKGLVQKDE